MRYRIPDISEFKQGFKFQRLLYRKGDELGTICYWNIDKPWETVVYASEDKWKDVEVWWDREPKWKKYVTNSIIVHIKEHTSDLNPGYELEDLLKKGKIRVKCITK